MDWIGTGLIGLTFRPLVGPVASRGTTRIAPRFEARRSENNPVARLGSTRSRITGPSGSVPWLGPGPALRANVEGLKCEGVEPGPPALLRESMPAGRAGRAGRAPGGAVSAVGALRRLEAEMERVPSA